jgi:hypothetical protein
MPQNERKNLIHCCVPFCPHSTDKFDEATEWLCPEHWRLVPRHLKRNLRLFKQRGYPAPIEYVWQRCKCRAIEAAFGIG